MYIYVAVTTDNQFVVSLQICIKGYLQLTHFKVDNPEI